MAACIEEGDGDDELDRFEEELMVVSLSGARSPEQSCILVRRSLSIDHFGQKRSTQSVGSGWTRG